jgi:hypothetical protein
MSMLRSALDHTICDSNECSHRSCDVLRKTQLIAKLFHQKVKDRVSRNENITPLIVYCLLPGCKWSVHLIESLHVDDNIRAELVTHAYHCHRWLLLPDEHRMSLQDARTIMTLDKMDRWLENNKDTAWCVSPRTFFRQGRSTSDHSKEYCSSDSKIRSKCNAMSCEWAGPGRAMQTEHGWDAGYDEDYHRTDGHRGMSFLSPRPEPRISCPPYLAPYPGFPVSDLTKATRMSDDAVAKDPHSLDI